MKLSIIMMTMFLVGCAALPIIKSKPYTGQPISEYQGFDKDTGIRYQISDDEDHLYLTFNTVASSTIMKILRGGLKVYFDESGKKRETVYLEYPLAQPMSVFDMKEEWEQPSTTLVPPVMPVSSAMVFVKNQESRTFDNFTENIGIQVDVSHTREELTYTLKIPLRELSVVEGRDLSVLSIGIVSGELEAPSSGFGMGASPSGGLQGGPGGGVGRSPVGGGGMAGRDGVGLSGNSPAVPRRVMFWFLVQL